MMCQACHTEMFVHKVRIKDGEREITYKCPNPKCVHFGFKKEKKA